MEWAYKLIATIMAFFLYFSVGDITQYAPHDAENLQTSFTVIADTHLESFTRWRHKNFVEALHDINAMKRKSDALIFLGDNTMNGQVFEQSEFYGLLKKHNTVENVLMVTGNHDLCPGKHNMGEYDDFIERFIKYNNIYTNNQIDKIYYSTELNGYKFVVLASEKDAGIQQYISEEQFEFLENELKENEKTDKPLFLFSHFPLDDVFSDVWLEGHVGEQSDRLKELLQKYDNRIFFFTGHLHMGVFENEYHIAEDKNITFLSLPAFGADNSDGDATIQDVGMGYQVEVYKDSVYVAVRNFAEHKWVEGYEYTFPIK